LGSSGTANRIKVIKQVKNHIDYISRNGEIELVNQDGDKETAKNVERFVKTQTHDKNQRSRSQIAYDRALDKIRDREKDREMVRKDIER